MTSLAHVVDLKVNIFGCTMCPVIVDVTSLIFLRDKEGEGAESPQSQKAKKLSLNRVKKLYRLSNYFV